MQSVEIIFSLSLSLKALPGNLHDLFREVILSSGSGNYDNEEVTRCLSPYNDNIRHIFKQLLKDYGADLEWSAFSSFINGDQLGVWCALRTHALKKDLQDFVALLHPFFFEFNEAPVIFERYQHISRYLTCDVNGEMQWHELTEFKLPEPNAADAWNMLNFILKQ